MTECHFSSTTLTSNLQPSTHNHTTPISPFYSQPPPALKTYSFTNNPPSTQFYHSPPPPPLTHIHVLKLTNWSSVMTWPYIQGPIPLWTPNHPSACTYQLSKQNIDPETLSYLILQIVDFQNDLAMQKVHVDEWFCKVESCYSNIELFVFMCCCFSFQARALTPQVAETDAIRFLVGTQSLRFENQVGEENLNIFWQNKIYIQSAECINYTYSRWYWHITI